MTTGVIRRVYIHIYMTVRTSGLSGLYGIVKKFIFAVVVALILGIANNLIFNI